MFLILIIVIFIFNIYLDLKLIEQMTLIPPTPEVEFHHVAQAGLKQLSQAVCPPQPSKVLALKV